MVVLVTLGLLPALGSVRRSPVGPPRALTNPPWQVDVVTVVGVPLTAAALWAVWRHFDWGRIVLGGAAVLLGTLVPYLAIAPFWNVSAA